MYALRMPATHKTGAVAHFKLLAQASNPHRPQNAFAHQAPYGAVERRLPQHIPKLKNSPAVPPSCQYSARIGRGSCEWFFEEYMLSRAKRRFGNAAMEVIGDGYDSNVDTRVSQWLQNVGRPAYIVPKELERLGDSPLRLV